MWEPPSPSLVSETRASRRFDRASIVRRPGRAHGNHVGRYGRVRITPARRSRPNQPHLPLLASFRRLRSRRCRASAEPRARRFFLSSATDHIAGARSSLRRVPRAVSRAAERRPTPPRPATLPLTAHRRTGSSSRHDDGERAPSREHVVPWSNAADLVERAPVASSGAACAVSRPRRRAPTDVITPSQLRCYSPPIAAAAPRVGTTTASARRAASTSFLGCAPPT